jgi:predicted nucleic acid-binding protein
VITVDTSVTVPAALAWHRSHELARSALRGLRPRLPAHVAIETYSVLTRLPPGRRLSAGLARDFLVRRFDWPPFVLSADGYAALLHQVAAADIAGGAVYDGLVGGTAREAGVTLLTRDRRAAGTYDVLGVEYRLLD